MLQSHIKFRCEPAAHYVAQSVEHGIVSVNGRTLTISADVGPHDLDQQLDSHIDLAIKHGASLLSNFCGQKVAWLTG